MEEALYHPGLGYYTSDRNPIGRQGDFYTSSDLDPVFGKPKATSARWSIKLCYSRAF